MAEDPQLVKLVDFSDQLSTQRLLDIVRAINGVSDALTAGFFPLGTVSTINVQSFVADGTYTPNPGMLFCIVEAVGGGGGGGGAAITTAGTVNGAGGGGGGEYARSVLTSTDIGLSKVVDIGTGGAGGAAGANNGADGADTTLGTSLVVAKKGLGGIGVAAATAGAGGVGGSGGTGNLLIGGQAGGPGMAASIITVTLTAGGASGGNTLSMGVQPRAAGNNGAASVTRWGIGGGGGTDSNNTANRSGGDGAPGLMIITEFCSA